MPTLRIRRLGPIDDCAVPMRRLLLLDGEQAAGKSTVGRAVFFFRTVKDELFKMVLRELYGSCCLCF